MPLTPGEQYEIKFPSPLDEYDFVTVSVTDDDTIAHDHFILELVAPLDAHCYKVRIADHHTPCSYALCSNGNYYLLTPGISEAGEVSPVEAGDTVTVTSEEIPVDTVDQWVETEAGYDVIMIYFTLIPDCAEVDITDPLQAVTASDENGYDPEGKKYYAAFPAAVQLHRGPDEKKMSRRKVKVIWSKDI